MSALSLLIFTTYHSSLADLTLNSLCQISPHSETVEYFTDDGAGGTCEDLQRVQIKVERDQYASTIAWLRDLIWGSKFEIDRCAFPNPIR